MLIRTFVNFRTYAPDITVFFSFFFGLSIDVSLPKHHKCYFLSGPLITIYDVTEETTVYCIVQNTMVPTHGKVVKTIQVAKHVIKLQSKTTRICLVPLSF